jgi:hypothetical protein
MPPQFEEAKEVVIGILTFFVLSCNAGNGTGPPTGKYDCLVPHKASLAGLMRKS